MKKLFIGLLAAFCAIAGFGQPTPVQVVEASAAQVAAGTAGAPYYVSPRRLAGGGGPGVFTSVTDTGLTSGRVVTVGTGGLLQDSLNLLFDGTSLTSLGYSATSNTTVYAATTDIVMTKTLQTVTLTGAITFTTSAKAAGQFVTVRIICDGTARAFTFPGTWVWVGSSAPAQIVASKVGVLSLICFGTTDADVVASWVTSL